MSHDSSVSPEAPDSPDDKVLFLTFGDPSHAYEAFHLVTELPGVDQAAIMERSPAGFLSVPESYSSSAGRSTLLGGSIGALLGLLGGPVGLLFGWGAGTMIGMAADNDDTADSVDSLTYFSRGVADGTNVLIVGMTETDPAVVDTMAARLGGTVVRVPAEEVTAEVRAAQDAAATAVREARRQHRESRGTEFREKVGALFHHQGS